MFDLSEDFDLLDAHHRQALLAKDVPPIFIELLELLKYDDGYLEWTEKARWIKFQEVVETEGNRWSKPHVSTPSLHGWMQLRNLLHAGAVMLDMEAKDLPGICDQVVARLVNDQTVTPEKGAKMKELWLKKHRHQFEGPRKMDGGNLSRVIKDLLVQKLENKVSASGGGLRVPGGKSESSSRRTSIYVDMDDGGVVNDKRTEDGKVNLYLQKKLESNAEAAVILEGTVGFLTSPVSVFVRLARPVVVGDLPEVDIPTRFLYFIATPPPAGGDRPGHADVGVSLGLALASKKFAKAVFHAESSSEMLDALDVYATDMKLLPGEFDTELNRIEPPSTSSAKNMMEEEDIDEDRRMREQSGLVRSGRWFGGLIADIKRKKPFYISDFTQGFHTQCISSFLFLYFACLAPIVAFGGLLGEATENRIATIESLVSGLISGVVFGLFSGQPLIILGSTGPVYVFEKILYQICQDQGWDYLSLRLWIGIWVGAILILLVVLDASAYVCYITRFTEELFATLIAFIFIFNSFKNLFGIVKSHKFAPATLDVDCMCEPPTVVSSEDSDLIWSNMTRSDCVAYNGTLVGTDCDFKANVSLMSIILFVFTFTISIVLKNFKNTGYLPGRMRNLLSDFAVPIAILSMTILDFLCSVETPKLVVPSSFMPTFEGRNWMVAHAFMFADHVLANPWYIDVFLAPLLAILATILIFMDQQITAVIVNRKEHKLKKGMGYHLDLLVLAFIIIIKSVFGLPWFVAATVLSINHIQSLTKESQSSAPGEKPHFLGIREQRVTAVLIAVGIGLSTLITPVLGLIPMPVLFGVFLFMGVSSLKGLQFFDRLLLFFIPRKHQPDYVFLKYVPLRRVHMFTLVQFVSLLGLWVIKSNPTTSISFPVMLVLICAIRKLMECVFSRRELRVLDDLLPENSDKTRRKRVVSGLFRLHGADWDDEEAEKAKKEEAKRKEVEEQEAMLVKRGRALTMELDDFGKGDMRAKMKNFAHVVRRRRAGSTGSRELMTGGHPILGHQGGPPHQKSIIFVRLQGQKVFTPMNLGSKTVRGLLRRLESKFPGEVIASRVAGVFQKTKKDLIFHLDDDTVELISSNEVFEVEVKPSYDDDEKYEVTLIEVDGGR